MPWAEYKAYLELHIASRTDEELRQIFLPRARQYEQVWRTEVRRAFPEWQDKGATFDHACEFTRSVLEGLLLNRDIWNDEQGEEGVMHLLNAMLQMLRKGEIKVPQPKKARASQSSKKQTSPRQTRPKQAAKG